MKINKLIELTAFAVLAFGGPNPLSAAVTYTDILFPASTTTEALGNNSAGDVVGTYGSGSGYVLSGGTYTSFNFAGATSTLARAINSQGQIVGFYVSSGAQHGFLRTGTSFTTIDVPGATLTNAFGINDNGQIVGLYYNGSVGHGFLLSSGTTTTLDFPGGTFTNAYAINNKGVIVGIYKTSATGTANRGFSLSGGVYTPITFPGASDTTAFGINDLGQIAGRYILNGVTHGFVLSGGVFTTIDPPGAVLTEAFDINNNGEVVGYYDKSSTPLMHTAFVSSPVASSGFALTAAASTQGTGTVSFSPSAPGNSYASGTNVCLTAAPAAGQIFTGYSGATLDAANCVTVSGNLSISASFIPNPITSSSALRFIPLAPCRVVDTRNPAGPLGGPALGTQGTRSFPLRGACGIPSTALAYALNLTVVPGGTLGYVTMWPTGQAQPTVSTLNSIDGRVKSNAAILPAGTGGSVTVFATDPTEVVLDISGYFDAATDPSALAFYPLTPCRIFDTRANSGALGGPSLIGGQMRIVPVMSSACGIPPNAIAYALNFTAVPQGPLQYLTVWPAGQAQPVASTLNAPTGTVTANAAIVPAGTSGAVDLFVTNNSDMVVDINGYFAAPGTGGYSLYGLAPCRIKDTRLPLGTPTFAGTTTISATGATCGVPPEARALVLNATVVPSGVLGYLTLWANGGVQPGVSTLNSLDGSITSNLGLIPTTNGLVNAFAAGPGSTYLLLDTSGYFAP